MVVEEAEFHQFRVHRHNTPAALVLNGLVALAGVGDVHDPNTMLLPNVIDQKLCDLAWPRAAVEHDQRNPIAMVADHDIAGLRPVARAAVTQAAGEQRRLEQGIQLVGREHFLFVVLGVGLVEEHIGDRVSGNDAVR